MVGTRRSRLDCLFGLHPRDVQRVNELLQKLRDKGNTVIVIEHNLHVIKNAHRIIDMDPEGGSKDGQVMFEGTPKELLKAKHSFTGAYLHH